MGCGASKKYAPVALEIPPRKLNVDWICKNRIDLAQHFEHKKVLGKGKFGIVSLTLCPENKQYVAIKYIPKQIIFDTKGANRIRQEIIFASQFEHPFIINYFGDFNTSSCVAMVFQYAPGGEFFTRMKKQLRMPESHAMFYFGEIALGLKYLHDQHIVYRYIFESNMNNVMFEKIQWRFYDVYNTVFSLSLTSVHVTHNLFVHYLQRFKTREHVTRRNGTY
jgi:serine/threonine protein kinase